MTAKEKHLSVLQIYLTQLKRRYEREFSKLGEDSVQDETRVPKLVELYHKIEDVTKEIEQLKEY